MQYSTCCFLFKSIGNGGQILYSGQIVINHLRSLAKVLDSVLQTEDDLKYNEIHEYCRNTKWNIPKTKAGPHAASSNAICCVPNGIGVGRWIATSMTVEMDAKNWTAVQALNDRTSAKAERKANQQKNSHLKYYNSPHSRWEIWRLPRFWTRDSWATNKLKIRIIPSKAQDIIYN